MAISKVILNGETQMDVTQKTVTAGAMLSGTTALKNDGTDITGTIASKTQADLTASGATVTAPAGYYASAASKSVASGSTGTPTASKGTVSNHSVSVTPSVTNTTGYITGGTKTGTAVTVSASELVSGTKTISASGTTDVTNYESVSVPSGSAKTPATTITANPTVSVNSSGLITATVSKTQNVTPSVSAGYVSSGTAGTITVTGSGTKQLTTQGAQGIHPSTTDQTIASGTYLTGAQTVVAVRTANLYASNIVNGVTIKIGDTTDDDCVASVTGKVHTSGYVATITRTGSYRYCGVTYDGVNFPHDSINTFLFSSGDVLEITSGANLGGAKIYIDGVLVANSGQDASVTYNYSLPANCINILMEEGNSSKVYVTTPTLAITENGTYNVGDYGKAEVNVPSGGRYVVTISGTGDSGSCFVKHNDTYYYTNGDTFTYAIGDTLTCWVSYGDSNRLYVDDIVVAGGYGKSVTNYLYTLPAGGIGIEMSKSPGESYIKITTNEPTISITSNGTYDVYEYSKAEVNVPSSGGNDFIITLTKNASTRKWEPDYTFAEAKAAYDAGKNIAFTTGSNMAVQWRYDSTEFYFAYGVAEMFSEASTHGYTWRYYEFSANGVELSYQGKEYSTSNATAVPADVASGKVFYNADGYQVGTASGGSDEDYIAMIERTTAVTSLPSTVTKIGDYAFYYCDKLALTSLPSGVTRIGDRAFFNCTKLALTSLPSGVTYIGVYAFYYCTNISLSSLPSGITTISTSAFQHCHNALTLSSLPSELTRIEGYAFNHCYGITVSAIPDGVTYIGTGAFRACESITSISCNGVITTLGESAFLGDTTTHPSQIIHANFPNMAVSSLGGVFGSSTNANACRLLEDIDIGNTAGLGNYAFMNCYKLQTLILRKSDAICTLANISAFTNSPVRGYAGLTATIYVPSALISTYQTATNWSTIYGEGHVTFAAIEGSQYEL